MVNPRSNSPSPQLSSLLRIVRLVWEAGRGYTVAWVVLLAIQGLLPAATVYLSRFLVDELVDAIRAGASWETASPVLLLAGLMAGTLLLTELLRAALEWLRTAQAELVQDHISGLVHEKSVALDLEYYESAEFHDRLDRARSDANDRLLALIEGAGSLLQNGITLVAMAALLIPYGAWLPPVLLASTLPALYVVVRFNRRFHHWWRETTADRRRTKYYDTMLTHSAAAPEVRLLSLGPPFQLGFNLIRRRLRGERLSLIRRQSLAGLLAGVLSLLVSGAAMAWMVWRALQGLVTLGDLVLFYQAFQRGQGLMRSLLGNLGQMYSNSVFVGDLFEFLGLRPKISEPDRPVSAPSRLVSGIAFRGVAFSYPGSDNPVLKDFDLTIPAGRTTAIVGPNGAGKSTLGKLLCRLYDPADGGIELDGIDIRGISTEELRRMVTVLFQFLVQYHATAAQNIALGDSVSEPGSADIESAARAAGIHEVLTRLPHGYDTLLGKWFADGVELSGGEWQRIALARAFVRQAPIMILDEPTSFMDSWSEIEWLERFRALAEGRTAIIITHRFTTAMRADLICVMSDGHVVESGSHKDLLANGGLYAQSRTAQMEVAGGRSKSALPSL